MAQGRAVGDYTDRWESRKPSNDDLKWKRLEPRFNRDGFTRALRSISLILSVTRGSVRSRMFILRRKRVVAPRQRCNRRFGYQQYERTTFYIAPLTACGSISDLFL